MATIDPVGSASVHKKIRTEQVLNPLLNRMSAQLIKLTCTMLESHEIIQLSKTSKYFHFFSKQELAERKFVSEELLLHVFKANPVKITEFFTKANSKKIHVLTRTCSLEGYYKKILEKYICVRYWRNVSPLQAAALCGDNFLVINLLSYIADNNSLRLVAAKQLEEVLNRTTKIREELAKKEKKSAADEHCNLDSKIKQKRTKTTSEVSPADHAEYLAPFKKLLHAYNNFIIKHSRLSAKGKWDTLENLWEKIGDYQNELSSYGLQEFSRLHRNLN